METKIEVQFKVEGQHITPVNNVTITSGSRNYYYAVFEFDNVWLGLNPKAAFSVGKKSYIIPLDNTQGKHECKIPWEVIARDIGFHVGVFGGDSLRSDTTFVGVIKGTQVDGDTAQPPTPDWYDKMEQDVNAAISTAAEVKKMADNGEFDGSSGKSAYELAVENGFTGTEEEWIESLHGEDGQNGADGYTPVKGVDYFDGKDGADGKNGYTPQKGIDYFDGADGYTPQKGIDYFDGKDGQNGSDGSDGYTPIKGVDYFTESEIESFKSDVTPQKGIDYFDGQNGQDGYTPQKGVDYFDGENGYTPIKGVDYFTPEEIEEIEQNAADKVDISDKLTQPATASVGQIFKVQSINEDGSLVLGAVDMPSGGAIDDVQVNGTSIVTDGIANIPKGSGSVLGVFKVNAGAGVDVGSSGDLQVKSANADTISKRNTSYQPITPAFLDIAVKYAMTDGKGAEWTDAEKTGAWKRLNSIKTAMDEIAVAGAQYYLGEQTAVDIVLPDDAQIGQMVTVAWYNGATAATLSITGTMLAFDYTPSANTRSEINALWDGRYWAVIGNEMEVPNE